MARTTVLALAVLAAIGFASAEMCATDYACPSGVQLSGTTECDVTCCGVGQQVVNRQCSNCGNGEVPRYDRSGCVDCNEPGYIPLAQGIETTPGYVKDTRVSAADAMCVPAADLCGIGQYADSYGTCSNCGNGEVPMADRSGCVDCNEPGSIPIAQGGTTMPGYVKDTRKSAADATCEPALDVCGIYGYANSYGTCSNCGAGQVQMTDGTGCMSALLSGPTMGSTSTTSGTVVAVAVVVIVVVAAGMFAAQRRLRRNLKGGACGGTSDAPVVAVFDVPPAFVPGAESAHYYPTASLGDN